ncbi:MAG: DUF2807 domain-containing protein, partial [Clostridia bacterium]|nr:DUF2807 domain-containing protein [Clostridia bacterium]
MSNYQTENIGKIIAKKRKEAGMTQETLASLLQITPQAISKWENGIGFPDLMLVPQIASALGISLSELFGEAEPQKITVPQTYMNMNLVCTDQKNAVYSNKEIASINDRSVCFSDGSSADMASNTVINCGSGEIRIIDLQDIIPLAFSDDFERKTLTKSFNEARSLEIINSAACEIEIIRGNDNETVIRAEGSKRFLDRLELAEANGRLKVHAQQSTNHGSEIGNSIIIAVGFDVGESLDVHINGCGELTTPLSFDSAKLTISGSGAVASAHTKNATVRIAGSGDLSTMQLDGDLDISVSGSGSVSCSGGEIDTLNVSIRGSGDLAGEWLTVNNADISMHGSGTISIGRIKGRSVER